MWLKCFLTSGDVIHRLVPKDYCRIPMMIEVHTIGRVIPIRVVD